MTLPIQFATQALTRLRGAAAGDTYGNDVIDWTDPDTLVVGGFTVQPVPAPEIVDGRARDAVGRRWLAIGPVTADITALDRCVFDGRTYDVDGEPLRFTTGILDHVELYLTDVAG